VNPAADPDNWQLYERLAAALVAETSAIEATVTANARVMGHISGAWRQIDVLLDARWGDDFSRRVIFDTKLYKTKLDVKDIESFRGMVEDCKASRGVLVCPKGCTDAARRRAQDLVEISILTLDQLQAMVSSASFSDCLGKCSTVRRLARQGLVLWDSVHSLPIDGLWSIIRTGKCDTCHSFHVWCWDCGEEFALRDEDEHVCSCQRSWITAIEEDANDTLGPLANAVHLLLAVGNDYWALDRRMMR
jgi:hypothetical protein